MMVLRMLGRPPMVGRRLRDLVKEGGEVTLLSPASHDEKESELICPNVSQILKIQD